jgi:hypothetical protein
MGSSFDVNAYADEAAVEYDLAGRGRRGGRKETIA